jgi:hypothetical protein
MTHSIWQKYVKALIKPNWCFQFLQVTARTTFGGNLQTNSRNTGFPLSQFKSRHLTLISNWEWFLVNDQRDAQFFSMHLFLFLTLHVSSTSCSSSGEWKCVNTTSGNSLCLLSTQSDSYQRLRWHNFSLLTSTMCSKHVES